MPDGHRAQLADVISAISSGRPPSVRGEDGYRALKFVLDVYAAAGCGLVATTKRADERPSTRAGSKTLTADGRPDGTRAGA